jgi:hypothetical protein
VPQVERLLPPPETPKETANPAPVDAAPAPAAVPPPAAVTAEAPKTEILAAAPPKPAVMTTTTEIPDAAPPAAPLAKAESPAPKKVAPKKEAVTIDKVIEKINAKTPVAGASAATGKVSVQLASLPDQAQARKMVANLQRKYAAELGDAKLHLARADLGSKGVYYRIQSDPLVKDEANRICSSLKQLNAGCILVGR